MHVITVRNVCDALPEGLRYLQDWGEWEESRNGRVLVAPVPVATRYLLPMERVLTAPGRDANPFFHLMEAMWMLAGRRDAAFLDTYVKDFGARYAEPDGTMWGAYGYRWFNWFGDPTELHSIEQLSVIAATLRDNPQDRRAVLSMWDANADLGADRRDIPCNTHAYFRVRQGLLDMTVCCRSNDMVWGAYGANAVHFAFLLEYVAAMVGVRPGTYTQVSNNYHVYETVLRTLAKAQEAGSIQTNDYRDLGLEVLPLVDDPVAFRDEVSYLLDNSRETGSYRNSFLGGTVRSMMTVHRVWSSGDRREARDMTRIIEAPDWRRAAEVWMDRRMRRV